MICYPFEKKKDPLMSRKTNSVSLRLKKTNKDYNNCWYGDSLYGYHFSKSLSIKMILLNSLKKIKVPYPKMSYIGAYKKANLCVCYLDPNVISLFDIKNLTPRPRPLVAPLRPTLDSSFSGTRSERPSQNKVFKSPSLLALGLDQRSWSLGPTARAKTFKYLSLETVKNNSQPSGSISSSCKQVYNFLDDNIFSNILGLTLLDRQNCTDKNFGQNMTWSFEPEYSVDSKLRVLGSALNIGQSDHATGKSKKIRFFVQAKGVVQKTKPENFSFKKKEPAFGPLDLKDGFLFKEPYILNFCFFDQWLCKTWAFKIQKPHIPYVSSTILSFKDLCKSLYKSQNYDPNDQSFASVQGTKPSRLNTSVYAQELNLELDQKSRFEKLKQSLRPLVKTFGPGPKDQAFGQSEASDHRSWSNDPSPYFIWNLFDVSCHFWGNFGAISFLKSSNEKACALFLAHYVSYFLERKVAFRRIKRQLLLSLLSFGKSKQNFKLENSEEPWIKEGSKNLTKVAGVRISCSGRVAARSKKAQRARKETFLWGETGLHVFNSHLDFAKTHAETPFGLIGVQVWVCYK